MITWRLHVDYIVIAGSLIETDLNVSLSSGGSTFLRNAAAVSDSHGGHLHIAHRVLWQSGVAVGVAIFGGDVRWGDEMWHALVKNVGEMFKRSTK